MGNTFRWMVFVIGLAVIISSIIVTSAGNPEIEIGSPSDGDTVYTDRITVYGTANKGKDGAALESVTVNRNLAEGTTSWQKVISLQPGPNTITAVATDSSGKCARATISVTYIEPTSTPTNGSSPATPPTTTTITNGDYRSTPTTAPIPTPTPTPTGSISITTIPCGAEVYLDDSPTKKKYK